MKQRMLAAILLGAGTVFGRLTSAETPDDPAATALATARAELAAAEKAVAERTAAVKDAEAKLRDLRHKLLAEEAWAARQAAVKAETSKADAEKVLAAKASQVKAAQEKVAAAVKAAETAAAEKAAAAKVLGAVPEGQEEQKVRAQMVLEQKAAAVVKAAEAVLVAKEAAEKASAEKNAAERALSDKAAASTAALDGAALAQAEALGGLKPIASKQWDYAKARHLLFRAGFGGSPEEVQRLVEMGPHKAVDYLVEYRNRPVANIEFNILPWERPLAYENQLHSDAKNKLAEKDERRDATQHAALTDWWVQRMVETPRPLEEKLVLFWHDHFASSYLTLRDAYALYQQNQFFRHYADNFDALLHGIVQDPAMIRYLNNDDNVKGNNNENLGREVLELFSLGEENSAAHKPDGYTEKDVRDANTRALTGATYERYSGQFRFHSTRHDSGMKTLLGKTGNWGPHEAVDIILEHPATARYLAKKFCQFFACWEPEPEVVERLAHVLRENNYAVRPMLNNLFLSEYFYSDKAMASHIKSPAELLVGTAKIIKLPKPKYSEWRHLLSNMGQALFDPPSVAGWPEDRDWINANMLMVRYTTAVNLVKSGNVDFVALLKGQQFNDSGEMVDHLARRCLLTNLSAQKRQALIKFLGPLPPSSQWGQQRDQVNAKLRALVVLLVSTPEYQVS